METIVTGFWPGWWWKQYWVRCAGYFGRFMRRWRGLWNSTRKGDPSNNPYNSPNNFCCQQLIPRFPKIFYNYIFNRNHIRSYTWKYYLYGLMLVRRFQAYNCQVERDMYSIFDGEGMTRDKKKGFGSAIAV